MKIGVISDTHDRLPYIDHAIRIFNDQEVEVVLHCGDFVSPFALVRFKSLVAPFYAVFGNNDGEKVGIRDMFDRNGWIINERPCLVTINGFSIVMLHEPGPLSDYLENEALDLIVFGHTHTPKFEKYGNTLALNPGEGCGWVSGKGTCAIIDLSNGEVEMFELSG